MDKALYIHYKEEFKYKIASKATGKHSMKFKGGLKKSMQIFNGLM